MKSLTATLGFFLLFAASPTVAQSPDSGSTPPPASAKPADPASTAPAATDKKKPKKVWTNDEIGSVKGNVSVVGDGNSPSAKTGQSQTSGSSNDARQQQIENYRNQIQGYKDQIDAIDKRIDQLKNFKAENTSPSGGINIHQGYNMVPLEDQVKQLEDKKKQLQSKIDDTEVDARKNGIDPGDLR
jgi:peptidoglycan hydrolase CwlO-like protein